MLAVLGLVLCVAAPAPPKGPRVVYVGAYLSDVSDFDLKAGNFQADLRVWMKWRGDPSVPRLSFENAALDQREEPQLESEGDWHAAQFRVQGKFRGEFPVNDFPFDVQTLPIVFALEPRDGQLVPDLGASGMSTHFSITGWAYQPFFTARTQDRTYGSDLGSIAREAGDTTLRQVTYALEVHRPFGPYLIKFAVPLALILLVALLALLLSAERLDVRSAMGITALLSCIAFHYTQSDTLPAVTYLVAADKLFLASYVFVTATLVLSVTAYRWHERSPARALAADRMGLWLLPALTLAGLLFFIAVPLRHAQEVAAPAPPAKALPTQPLLRVAVASLDTLTGSLVPGRRGALVVRGADRLFRPELVEEAPAMTNALVRLLPDGGMRVRWRLREGATWSDGTPITSEDLAFSLTLQKEPLCTGWEQVDPRTLDVTYSDRRSDWLAGFTLFPRSARAATADGGREALTLLHQQAKLPTSGAYTTAEFVPGARAVLARNASYAGPKPAFERVEVSVLPPLDAARALLAGTVDVLPTLTPDAFALLEQAPGVRVLEQPGDQLWVLVPNLSAAPWDALEARRALLGALDRQALVAALAPAPTRVAWGWRADPPPKLPPASMPLAGLALTLNVDPIRSADATHAVLAKALAEQLTRAGLHVTVRERTDLRQAVQEGSFEGLALVVRDTTELTRFLNVTGPAGRLSYGTAQGAHFDAEMVERLDHLKNSLYAERRDALELEFQRAWFERLPMLPLVAASRLSAVRESLEGPEWGHADSLWWNLAQWRFTKP